MGDRRRIGVIGGSGYIGSSVANHLSKSFNIRIIDLKKPPLNLLRKVEYFRCDIAKIEEVKKALSDVDVVVHAAIVQIPSINEHKRLGYETNVIGTQNVCKAVDESPTVKGMIVAGTWHTFGESGLTGVIDESFGYRPDKVEERARLYALSKLTQEAIVRIYNEMSDKIYGIIRMGTVLGEGMPEKTAAHIFIEKGVEGESLTPYKHSMHRPMLYVDILDVLKAHESFITNMLDGNFHKSYNSLSYIVNLCYPEPMTILELAKIIRDAVIKRSNGRIKPKIEIVDIGKATTFTEDDKKLFKVSVNKAFSFLGLKTLTRPRETIFRLVNSRLRGSYL